MANHLEAGEPPALETASLDDNQKAVRRKTHETIAKVEDDYGRRQTFNTAVAAIMELTMSFPGSPRGRQNLAVEREALRAAVLMLQPIAPYQPRPVADAGR